MNPRLLAGAAFGAFSLGMVGVATHPITTDTPSAVPFVNPLLLNRSVCGRTPQSLPQRRAYFVRMASAWAESPANTEITKAQARRMPVAGLEYSVDGLAPEAQSLFNAGLAHMFNFNHGEAVDVFRAAQELAPDCALCFWAEALALGPNINAAMAPDANPEAFAALQKAISLKAGAGMLGEHLIDALAARYTETAPADRSALDNAYADAMERVASDFPNDDFVAVLSAEANMDTQPWDYWESDGRTPKGRAGKTLSLLEGVLALDPDNIPAIHLYIHTTEATNNPYRARPYADRLASLSPGLGHLIHMPSHVYYRIGDFKASIDHNIKAIEADEAFLAGGPASLMYEFGYFVHNIHFLLTSAHMAGDRATALDMAQKLDTRLPLDMAREVPTSQPIKAAPYYAMAQFGTPEEVLALPKPEGIPFLEGVWHYARGEALIKLGRLDEARAQAEAITSIYTDTDFSDLVNNYVPAPDILTIASLTLQGKAAAAEGDLGTGIEAMSDAVAMQENIAYMEPPYWYYPAKQTLAALVLKDGQAERAEQLFLEALVENPNNGWVLYGLTEAYSAQGDKAAARYSRELLHNAWAGSAKDMSLNDL